jgi:predicted PurR-regulated permease PerM
VLFGQHTGLSPVAVVVSTLFWALLWGPIGLLLATPLTVCLVVLGRHIEALQFIEVLLATSPPWSPRSAFISGFSPATPLRPPIRPKNN